MAKIQGTGGSLTKDAVALSVKRFDWEEVEGIIYGQKQSNINVTVYIDSTTFPIRHGDTFDAVLTVSGDATWDITVDDVRVESMRIPVAVDDVITQDLTLIGRTTAVIA